MSASAPAPAVSVENLAHPVREEDAFDVDAVDALLQDALPDLRGTPTVRQYPSGASNLTYELAYPGRALVLRRPPMGKRPKSGHSMIREHTVITKLAPVFPAVPKAVFYHPDEGSPLGAEFYVMEKTDGLLLKTEIPGEWGWGPAETRAFCERFWDALVALHAVDVQAAGLSDFGKPEGYVARQIGGWNARYDAALTDDADPFEDVRAWLAENQPADSGAVAVLHGDYRIDNLILDANDPMTIAAVLDWEIAALGDPLMDLGAALAYWIQADDPPALHALKKQPSDAPGMLTRAQVVERYAQKTGAAIKDPTFYYVYGVFRLAVIAQQIYYRYFHKQTSNDMYALFGPGAKGLGQYCRVVIDRGRM